MDQMTPGMQPSAEPDADEMGEADDAGATEYCIREAADGSLSTYMEVDGKPQGEPKPAADATEALKAVVMLMREAKAGGGEDQLQAGFASEGQSTGSPISRRTMQQ
jgi:hypothetical protein